MEYIKIGSPEIEAYTQESNKGGLAGVSFQAFVLVLLVVGGVMYYLNEQSNERSKEG